MPSNDMPPGADRWQTVRDILYEALQRTPEARAGFLHSVCGGDFDLRREVDELLRASEGTLDIESLAGDPARELPPGSKLGRYIVRRKIGEGGMGSVYEAEDPELGRLVALKIIAGGAESERVRRRFAREARAASALNHPGIVTIYDIGNADDLTFIAMELVEGETLLAKAGAPLPQMVYWMRQAAEAVAAAHAAGIVHRDLKPGNLMVTPSGKVKVLDFGLARRPEEKSAEAASLLTGAGQILGTPAYMSPEQALGEPVGPASDIFSFGVVFYELVCGVRPFSGKTAVSTIDQVLHHEPPSPRQASPGLSRDLTALIERCIQKSPEARPTSMAEVAETLRLFSSPPQRRSRRGFFAVAGGLAVAAAGSWIAFRPKPAIQWSMEARASAEDLPRPARLSDTFRSGTRFRLRLRYPRNGRFYVVNHGPTGRYWILFAVAAIADDETVTDWFAFDETPGTERLHLAWSATPVSDLEAAGPVDPANAARVSAALARGTVLDLRHE